MRTRHRLIYLALFGLLTPPMAYASCGSTACSINTNWDEHSASKPGWAIDLRYSYSNADQLRSGSKQLAISPSDPAYANAEVENLRTINKLLTASVDYTHDDHWGWMLSVPYVMRDHMHTIGSPTPPFATDSFTANALGDIKIIGRYRWALNAQDQSDMGVKLGVKLNTGRQDFLLASGSLPNEVTLQTGSGSTDLIVGVFWQQAHPASALSWFAQGMSQSALNNRADFRPGNQHNFDGGVRYSLSKNWSGVLQLNAQWNEADAGPSAALTLSGAQSSGGKNYWLTPGLIYAMSHDTNLYALVQQPLYRYVNGEQLSPDFAATVGINHHF